MLRGAAVGLIGACVLVARPAAAEDDVTRARQLFQLGVALAHEGKCDRAIEAFRSSAKLRPHAKTTYNLGFCEKELGHYTRALAMFARAADEDARRGGSELG